MTKGFLKKSVDRRCLPCCCMHCLVYGLTSPKKRPSLGLLPGNYINPNPQSPHHTIRYDTTLTPPPPRKPGLAVAVRGLSRAGSGVPTDAAAPVEAPARAQRGVPGRAEAGNRRCRPCSRCSALRGQLAHPSMESSFFTRSVSSIL